MTERGQCPLLLTSYYKRTVYLVQKMQLKRWSKIWSIMIRPHDTAFGLNVAELTAGGLLIFLNVRSVFFLLFPSSPIHTYNLPHTSAPCCWANAQDCRSYRRFSVPPEAAATYCKSMSSCCGPVVQRASGNCTTEQQMLCSKHSTYSKYDRKNSPEEGDEELHQVHDAVVLRESNLKRPNRKKMCKKRYALNTYGKSKNQSST